MTIMAHPDAPQLTIGSTPTSSCTSPTPTTSSAARWPPSRSPPPRPATSSCRAGPTGWGSPSPGGGGHRLLRRRPRPLPGHPRPGRDGGQPTRPPSPAPPRQVRPPGCPGRPPRTCRPARSPSCPRPTPARWRDDPLSAGGPHHRPTGPHPDHQRPQGTAGHRPRRAPRAAPRPVGDPAGGGRGGCLGALAVLDLSGRGPVGNSDLELDQEFHRLLLLPLLETRR